MLIGWLHIGFNAPTFHCFNSGVFTIQLAPFVTQRNNKAEKKHNLWSQEGNIFCFGTKVLTKQFLSASECGVRSSHLLASFRARCSCSVQWWKDHRHWSHLQWIHERRVISWDPRKPIDFSPFLKGKERRIWDFVQKARKVFPTLKIRTQRIFWYPKSSLRFDGLMGWHFLIAPKRKVSDNLALVFGELVITNTLESWRFSVVLCRNQCWRTPGSNVRHQ